MEEFNQIHKSKKICEDYFLTKKNPGNVWWHNQIYIYHDFDHPRYNDFIADRPQKGHAESIRLK
jgi:hypothetical protein